MPYKNGEEKNRWERRNKAKIRKMLIEYLGGRCIDCKKSEPEVKLEFDHVLPCEKEFRISREINKVWDKLKVEVDKCQLLCHDCHMEKTYGKIPF